MPSELWLKIPSSGDFVISLFSCVEAYLRLCASPFYSINHFGYISKIEILDPYAKLLRKKTWELRLQVLKLVH